MFIKDKKSKNVETKGSKPDKFVDNKKSNNKSGNHQFKGKGNRDKHDDSLSYGGKELRSTGSGKSTPNTFPGNDITWYQRVPNLLETAKQVTYNIPLGVRLKSTHRAVPGIIALDYCPIVGYTESNALTNRIFTSQNEFYDVWAATPFNIAMRNAYSKVRSSKGGSRPYDYPDLAQMLLSATSIYAYIVHLQRVLRCVNRFNFENKYLGQGLVSALGFNYSNLVYNYMLYLGRLNLLVEKAKTVAIPAGLAVLDEWLWRNSNIFKDTNTDNVKQQFIVDVPNGYYVYNEAAGEATYKPVTVKTNSWLNMSNVLGDLESAVSQLWNSETFAILMGDLRFAYKDNVVSIPQMTVNETVEPIFNLEHAIGVQNMNFVHTIISYDGATDYTSGSETTGLLDEHLVAALTVHQDMRAAELNNGAVFAGPAYSDDIASSKLRGYKIYMGDTSATTQQHISTLVSAHRSAGFCDWSYISMYNDIPDGETLIYATRMKMVGSFVNTEGGTTFSSDSRLYYQILSSTSCLWLGPRILIEPALSTTNTHSNGYRIFNVISNNNSFHYNTVLLYGLSNFNIAPKAILYVLDATDTTSRFCYILGDIEVGTDISSTSLAMLQAVCAYSQWLIPDTIDVEGFTPRTLTK